MALLVLLVCRELFGFASHSNGDPQITNDVLYQLSYTGPLRRRYSIGAGAGEGEICAAGAGARAPAARVQALSTPRLIR